MAVVYAVMVEYGFNKTSYGKNILGACFVNLVSLPSIMVAPLTFILLFAGKIIFKIFGLYSVMSNFKKNKKEKWYYTLLMSTGLTFGTISALYGYTNNIITKEQYSYIVATVIASAVLPTLIANKFFLPRHLIEEPILDDQLSDNDKKD